METRTVTTLSLENLTYLPKFAAYLRSEKLEAFVRLQIDQAFELDVPLLKYFLSLPDDTRMAISLQSNADLLDYLVANKADEQIKNAMQEWKANRLPVVDRDAIVAEDITLINYIRKKSMLELITGYTTDPFEIVELAKEIDQFSMASITAATNLFIDLYRSRLEENSHFLQKVVETIPGAVYVFDTDAYSGIYANKKLPEVIGYTQDDLNALGEASVPALVHPEDQAGLQEQMKRVKTTNNDDVHILKYRIRTTDGSYKWLANYESVFKRNDDGSVSQIIGITLDIDKEQKALSNLRNREQQLTEAQEIALLGDFYWDFAGERAYASSKTLELLEVDGKSVEDFLKKVHPQDRQIVQTAIEQAKESGTFNCEYRIVGQRGIKNIWGRGVVEYRDGRPAGMSGTVMDITEHNQLLQKLAEADRRHKQAEALAHIGTFAWNLVTGEVEWSEEMYRIYGVEPTQKLTYEWIVGSVHADDARLFDATVQQSIRDQEPFDLYCRILTKSGEERILHCRGNVEVNEKGETEKVVGTNQDVTEKQTLIRRLQRSESMYVQAEKIADMGNWNWDLKTGRLSWTDQLYRIYGLEPQSEEITLERFLSFVHPDDREHVARGVDQLPAESNPDYTFRIVTGDGTEKWLRSMAQVVRGEDGQPTLVLGIEQNVSERQNLIAKLEESQRLYKQAQELARMGSFSWNVQTGDVYWSDEVYKIYELPFGDKVTFGDAFRPVVEEHKALVQKSIDDLLATKKGQNISYAIRKKDGGLKYVNLFTDAMLAKDGSVACVVGTTQDVTEKEELIHRLRESEQLYKQAQALAKMGNWTYDLTTNTVGWSDEMFAIYEKPKGDSLSVGEWKSFLTPEEAEQMFTAMDEVVRDHKPLDVTHHITTSSGAKKVLHRRGEVVYGPDGTAVKIIGTTQDITEQFKTQAELRDSQNFIRKITDATPSIISSYNINTGKYTFISGGLEKLLGYPTHEAMEKGVAFFAGIIHPDDAVALQEKNEKVLEEVNGNPDKKDTVAEFTYRMRHRDGDYRWFHTYGTVFDFNAEGKVEHILNITLDVTEQKQAVETIREQEYFIQQIADASPTILYLFDVPSQSMAYINREAFFVLGYLPEEITEEGSNVTSLLYHPDDLPLLPGRTQSRKNFQQVDSMIQYECRMKHKDGDYRWLLVREIVFKSEENGGISQIIGAALDITRRKEMERTILQNAHQLEQSNASLEEFAYVASHDLKEPLRKISTFGDRLAASQADRLSNEGQIYLNKIIDASQRMQAMISDLLSISMISGNRQFEKVSLQKIMADTLQTLEFKIEQQNAVVRYNALPEANVVPSQFRQLFQNLIANSLKFVRDGVQPVIAVEWKTVTDEEVTAYQVAKAPSYLRIAFSDNGIGFENEYAQKIFAIFHRLHGRSEYEGSGIGLAICKKIVEHHGGVIFASGQPGAGATFTLIIPA